jgi:hypothetical protein
MKSDAHQSQKTTPDTTETLPSQPLAGGDPHQTGVNRTKPDLIKLKSSEAASPNLNSASSVRACFKNRPGKGLRARRARRSARTPDLAAIINSISGWHRHPRNGKVARLPEATRLQINRMLDDGMMYRTILAKLREINPEDLPCQLSEMNLSNWFRGGYQQWCRKREQEAFRRELESRIELRKATAHASPITPHVSKCNQT